MCQNVVTLESLCLLIFDRMLEFSLTLSYQKIKEELGRKENNQLVLFMLMPLNDVHLTICVLPKNKEQKDALGQEANPRIFLRQSLQAISYILRYGVKICRLVTFPLRNYHCHFYPLTFYFHKTVVGCRVAHSLSSFCTKANYTGHLVYRSTDHHGRETGNKSNKHEQATMIMDS